MTLENWPRTPALIAKAARFESRKHRVDDLCFAEGWVLCICGGHVECRDGDKALMDAFSAHRRAHGCTSPSKFYPAGGA